MEIILSKNAGFCPGVRRADREVMRLVKDKQDNQLVFTLGKLIHNGIYVSQLEELGVRAIEIDELDKILLDNPDKKISLVIRTHGITLEVEERLLALAKENPRLNLVDMTCPSVKKIHKIADTESGEGRFFILFGSPTHPESLGIISRARGDKAIITCLEELQKLDFQGKVPILCAQTTQNLLQFIQIKKFLKKLYTNAIFLIQYVVSLKIVSMRQSRLPKSPTL